MSKRDTILWLVCVAIYAAIIGYFLLEVPEQPHGPKMPVIWIPR